MDALEDSCTGFVVLFSSYLFLRQDFSCDVLSVV